MTVARIIAISLMVCAMISLTTQAEAAKRKSTITFRGCADLDLLCGAVMKDAAGNRHAFIPSGLVPPGVPLKVVGRRSGDVPGGWCKARRVQVLSVTPTGGTCGVSAR